MRRKQEGILSYFARHNRDFSKKVGYSRAPSTYARYKVVYGHLSEYVQKRYKRDDVLLSALRVSLIERFDIWLRKNCKLSPNSVWVYMIALKHIFKLAQNEGLMNENPFASYINSFTTVDRGYLTEEELQRILQFEPTSGTEARVRDLFVFSAFTGLSYSDIKDLSWENVRTLFDGQTWLVTRRRKTNTPSNILLLDIPRRLMERHGNRQATRIFSVPSNNCCNEYLAGIGRKCDIPTHISFHIARHTFATLSLSKGVPIETLSAVLGHTNIRTTQIYAKITNKKISEDMAAFADRIRELKLPE